MSTVLDLSPVGVDADDPKHRAGRFLDGDEGHGACVIDLRESRDEAVAELLDRREETQSQIVLGHCAEELRV